MSACEELATSASAGVAPALRAVDCLANETAASAFGRLFGSVGGGGGGAMLPALTILLTLYIAFFAISLLTGRSRIGISALTPRMMTLGLVLTFATSWAAWQGVVWNLAIGAPDQLASVMMGTKGSATQLFADRLDMIFVAISQAADAAGVGATQGSGAQATAPAAAAVAGSFTPSSLMWLAALLLLLGTVGVLVTARIALGVLLAIGPVFVVLALFSGTRGLFAGWLRGLVLTAVTPLFVVVGGSMMLELMVPLLRGLVSEGQINGYAAMALFLIASVHVALMAMVLKVMGSMVSGWQVFGSGRSAGDSDRRSSTPPAMPAAAASLPATVTMASRRAVALATVSGAATGPDTSGSASASTVRHSRTVIASAPSGSNILPLSPRRANGIGSRFAARPHHSREMIR